MSAPDRPTLEREAAASLVCERWGLAVEAGDLRELGSYADRNFELCAGEERWLLKLTAAASEPREIVDMQIAALEHLAARPSGALVQRVRASLDGAKLVAFEDAGGQPCFARVYSFIPGQLWSDLDWPTPALRRDLGHALASLDRDLEDFEHPAMERSFRWNLAEAEWIADEFAVIEDRARRASVVDALAQFRARVSPRLDALPAQLIHGDVNDQNLVVEGDALRGIIDFGDCTRAPTICELAIALAYAAMVPDPIQACAEVCAAYHERRPISELELDLLVDLIRARLAVSVVSSALARAREPHNAYVVASEEPAWHLLGTLRELGRGAVTRYIAGACGLATPVRVPGVRPRAGLLDQRRTRLGASLSLGYDEPLYLRRGEGSWLFDEDERAFLDCVNNVCHVGHCHPRVVAAASRQIATLNTNTRYLHEAILRYADRLCATLPRELEVVFMVNSGSEANELALRLARAHMDEPDRAMDVAVVAGGYHGHTTTLIELSPYKFDGPGGRGRPDWVHVIDTPDPYRGRYGDDGPAYAVGVSVAAEVALARGARLGAFLAEPILGCAGQIVPAPGFLAAAYERARAAGALCIADEVQVGFGRVGDAMWAFELEGVVPDILTLGKPIGNGHPIGAVVTTAKIAASFAASGMEYFNTFGGNPVSCVIASAVLDVVELDELQASAREVGAWLRGAILGLADPGVGEVRGRGLFLGVELVEDRVSKSPDPERASAVVEHARHRGVLLSVDGPAHNVVKIKPPLRFGPVEARILVDALAAALAASPRR